MRRTQPTRETIRLVHRAGLVIERCETLAQLQVAGRYADLVVQRIAADAANPPYMAEVVAHNLRARIRADRRVMGGKRRFSGPAGQNRPRQTFEDRRSPADPGQGPHLKTGN